MVLLSSTSVLLLLGPAVSLVYPLFSSIRAIETNSDTNIQQWLTYWVLFTLITILEFLLANVLQRIPIWPCAKMIVILCLVLPYFGGASHVYEHCVRPCFSFDLQKNSGKSRESKLPGKDVVLSWRHDPKTTQKESGCELCIVTTTCEEDLRRHLKRKKHQANEDRDNIFGLAVQGADIADLVEGIDQNLNNPLAKPIQFCIWEKPEVGWTKLNTDGSIGLTNAGLGGLLRDHLGHPTCAYVSKVPRDGIFAVEIWAIWRGLVLALGQGVKAIWVESDSMSVVQAINKQWSYHQRFSSCLKKIWELLNKFEKHRVSHSWRETNRAADHLSKMNLTGRDVVLWPGDFPESLCNIIKEDAEGKVYVRR